MNGAELRSVLLDVETSRLVGAREISQDAAAIRFSARASDSAGPPLVVSAEHADVLWSCLEMSRESCLAILWEAKASDRQLGEDGGGEGLREPSVE
jgi:hypothetical protein